MRSSEARPVTILSETSQSTSVGAAMLPPLSSKFPQWSRTGKLKVDVFPKPFPNSNKENLILKVNKKGAELSAVGRTEGLVMTPTSDPLLRITQLEQNIKFLQEQHHLMLTSLHLEVEQLRQRNRDLQYQLVFSSSSASVLQNSPSPCSSSEDDSKPKLLLTPKSVNITPLQVEILERDIAELKAALQESKTKNLYLSGIVEEQKKKLETLEALEAVGNKITLQSPGPVQSKAVARCNGSGSSEIVFKLEEAENVIRCLRKENEDLKKELTVIRANLSREGTRQLGGNANRTGTNGHHRSQHPQFQRFPPLHSQSFWHHGNNQQSQRRSSMEYVSHRHCANRSSNTGNNIRVEKENQMVGRPAPSLPNLRNNASTSDYGYSNGNNHRRGRYNGNGNHYYRNSKEEGSEGRKHREANRDRDIKQ